MCWSLVHDSRTQCLLKSFFFFKLDRQSSHLETTQWETSLRIYFHDSWCFWLRNMYWEIYIRRHVCEFRVAAQKLANTKYQKWVNSVVYCIFDILNMWALITALVYKCLVIFVKIWTIVLVFHSPFSQTLTFENEK